MSKVEPGGRFARYFVGRGWAHVLLLTGALLFLFPFVWMVLTSFKTDEEITEGGWWPTVPVYRQSSPYARRAIEVRKPANVTEEAWDARLPVLRDRATSAVASQLSRAGDQAAPADTVVSVLLDRLAPRLPNTAWTASGTALADAWDALLTAEAIDTAIDDRTARLELLALQLRALDASIHNVFSAADIQREWNVTSGSASLVAGRDAAGVHYDFSRSTDAI
jgi:ABC-type glycerol-3-phosphate transport system permease component